MDGSPSVVWTGIFARGPTQVSERTAAAWAQGAREVLSFADLPAGAARAFRRGWMFADETPLAGERVTNAELAASYAELARGG